MSTEAQNPPGTPATAPATDPNPAATPPAAGAPAAEAAPTETPEAIEKREIGEMLAAVNAVGAPPAAPAPAPTAPAPTDPAAAGTPAPAGAAPDPKKPDDKKAEPPPALPDVEDEIKGLGITNDKTAARFRELHSRAKAGEEAMQRAAAAEDMLERWEQTIGESGANEQQFAGAMTYLTRINSGDPKQIEQALNDVLAEAAVLAKAIGREIPGLVDPLDDFPDLKTKVENLEMDRETALAWAADRRTKVMHETAASTRTASAAEKARYQRGYAEVKALGDELRAADPAAFQAKSGMLGALVNDIAATLPPEQWVGAIRRIWGRLPTPAAAAPAEPPPAAPAKPAGVQPLRGGGAGPGHVPNPKDEVAAMLAVVNGTGPA